MHLFHERLVRAFSLFFVLAFVISGCGNAPPAGPPKPRPKSCMPGELTRDDGTCQPAGLPPDMPCPPGELALDDGTCQPAGLPADMPCPPGELDVNGTCQPAGVPPSACGEGFMPDGKQGCEPILPAAPCPAGQMAIPGETACHEVSFCGHGTWGSIPVDADTQFVDQAYAGGGSNGTKAKPWTTIQQGIDAAKQGAAIAVAAGKYVEDLLIQGKAVRLSGRCPALVEVSGKTTAIQVLQEAAGGTEIRDLAVTGMGVGIGVKGASGVVIARVWAHDTAAYGLDVAHGSSPTGASLTGSLFEHTTKASVRVHGAEATIEATVVRDTLPDGQGLFGLGFIIENDLFTQARANVTVRACLIEQNRTLGVLAVGSDATIEATVVRGTLPDGQGRFGRGINIEEDPKATVRSNVTIRACFVAENHEVGVYVGASDAIIEATVVRDNLPAANGVKGWGILIVDSASTTARANVTIRACLVAENHWAGVSVVGSDATIEASVVRENLPTAQGDGGWGIDIEQNPTTEERASVTIMACLVEQNREIGVVVLGADATIEATVVRSTLPDAQDQGAAIEVEDILSTKARANVTIGACLLEQNEVCGMHVLDSDVIVRSSVIAQNRDVGVIMRGAKATFEATVVRDTLPDAKEMFGRGLDISVDDDSKARSSATMRACLVEHNHENGVSVFGSDAIIEASVVRSNGQVAPQGFDVFGILIQDCPCSEERANGTVRACLVEQNYGMGVYVGASDAIIETTVVRDTLSDAMGPSGHGISVVRNPDTDVHSSATVRACLVEQNQGMGVGVAVSDATIVGTIVRGTKPDAERGFGDGISIFWANVTIQDTESTGNARAGVSNFGAAVEVTSSTFTCNAFDLEGGPLPESDFSFDGSTGWQCSQRGNADCNKLGACHVETDGLESPSFDLPPVEMVPQPGHM